MSSEGKYYTYPKAAYGQAGAGAEARGDNPVVEVAQISIGIFHLLAFECLENLAAHPGLVLRGEGRWEVAFAYGDHHSDVPMLQMAVEQAYAVSPDNALEREAKQRGWTVLDW